MAIVTISSELGAGGPEIGMTLAKQAGYRYVDREIISDAANRYGLEEAKLVRLDESKPSLFGRIDSESRLYVAGTRAVMFGFARQDNVILFGRGGQWLLRHIPHALSVRVTAPLPARVARLAQKIQGEAGKAPAPRALVDVVRRDDAARSGRIRYLYGFDINDPAMYDLVFNTTQISVQAVADVLTALVRRPELATTEPGQRIVTDRSLAALIEVALAADPETRRSRIRVMVDDGVVTLEGATDLERAEKIVRDVAGVREVRIAQTEIQPPVAF